VPAELAVLADDSDPVAEDERRTFDELLGAGGVVEDHHRIRQRSLGDLPHGGRQMSVFCADDLLGEYPSRGFVKRLTRLKKEMANKTRDVDRFGSQDEEPYVLCYMPRWFRCR